MSFPVEFGADGCNAAFTHLAGIFGMIEDPLDSFADFRWFGGVDEKSAVVLVQERAPEGEIGGDDRQAGGEVFEHFDGDGMEVIGSGTKGDHADAGAAEAAGDIGAGLEAEEFDAFPAGQGTELVEKYFGEDPPGEEEPGRIFGGEKIKGGDEFTDAARLTDAADVEDIGGALEVRLGVGEGEFLRDGIVGDEGNFGRGEARHDGLGDGE